MRTRGPLRNPVSQQSVRYSYEIQIHLFAKIDFFHLFLRVCKGKIFRKKKLLKNKIFRIRKKNNYRKK